ncbi:unnamed protein product, partial [Amoebophrya sp. A25]
RHRSPGWSGGWVSPLIAERFIPFANASQRDYLIKQAVGCTGATGSGHNASRTSAAHLQGSADPFDVRNAKDEE